MTVLCVVAATRMSFSSAKHLASEGDLEVFVMINKLSDTSNLFQYGLSGGSNEIMGIADLDDLEMLKSCAVSSIAQTMVVLVGNGYQKFRIDNLNDYNMFNDLVSECRMLTEMTLRLDCFTRDIYFAGVYSTCEIEGGLLLSEMLQKVQNQQKDPSQFQIFDISSRMSGQGDRQNSVAASSESNAITTQHHIMSEINCVFCGTQKMMEISRDFTVHPYVSATFEKKHIYMCIPCVHNWKQFREKAITDNQLVLKDEVNEELCGICSDTPAELIMCSECPRSFCNVCLLRILNEKEFKELDSLTDWICMCCHLQESHFSPSLDSSDWPTVKPAIGVRPNSNNVYFSKSNVPSFKSSINLVEKSALRKKFHGEIDVQFCPEVSCLPSTFSPRVNAVRSPHAVSKIVKTSASQKEISIQREYSVKKEVLSGVVSVPEDLPYLDDFDDGSSSEEERALDDLDDDDCNLIIALPTARYSLIKSAAKKKSLANLKSKKLSDCLLTELAPRKRLKNMQKVTETEISTFPMSRNTSLKGSKKDNKRNKAATLESQGGAVLPPVNTAVDEVYYFSQYVQANKLPKEKKSTATDDVCFLCKDGGDLIECDDSKCRKVYHSYCLSYFVEDDGRDWRCPRHFCDYCGSVNLKYVCKFCPMSICKNCPTAMVKKYGLARYKVVDTPKTGEFSPKVIVIVCQNCLDMYDRCLSRGSDYNTFSDYFTDIMDNSPELSFIESKKIDVIADSELTAVDAACVSSRSHPAVCKGVIKRLAESVIPIIKDTAVSRSHPNKDSIRDKDVDEKTAAVIDPLMSCSTALDTTVCTREITSDVLVTTAETDHVPILPTRTDSDKSEALDVGVVTAHLGYKAATLSEPKKKGRKPKLRLCEVAVKDTLQDYCSAAPYDVDVTDSREHDSSMSVDVMDILEAEVPGMGTGIGIPHDSEPPTANCTISQATYYSNSTATRGAVVSLVNDRRIWKGSAVTCKASEAQKKKQKIFNPNTAGSFAKTRPTLN